MCFLRRVHELRKRRINLNGKGQERMDSLGGRSMTKIEHTLYELIYSPIITPRNLVDNIHLDNYEYIKFYKVSKNIVCEMKCTLNHGTIAIFNYYFSEKEFLEKITKRLPGKDPEVVFNRVTEIHSLTKKLPKPNQKRRFA